MNRMQTFNNSSGSANLLSTPVNLTAVTGYFEGHTPDVQGFQGVTYMDEGATVAHATPAPLLDPTPASSSLVDAQWSYMSVLNRPLLVGVAQWTSAQVKGTILWQQDAPSGLIAASPTLTQQAIAQFNYMRSNIELTALINATPMNKGMLRLYFVPQGHCLQDNALTVAARTANEGLFMDAANTKQAQLPTPYCARQDFLDTEFKPTTYGLSTDMGRFYLVVEAQLDACEPVEVSLVASFPGAQLAGPRAIPLTNREVTARQADVRYKALSYPFISKFERDLVTRSPVALKLFQEFQDVLQGVNLTGQFENAGQMQGIGDFFSDLLSFSPIKSIFGGGGGGGNPLIGIGNTTNTNIGSADTKINFAGGNIADMQTRGDTASSAQQRGGDMSAEIPPISELDQPDLTHMGLAVFEQETQQLSNLHGAAVRTQRLDDFVHSRREAHETHTGIGADEMNLDYLASRPTARIEGESNLIWSSDQQSGHILWTDVVTVCPQLNDPDLNTAGTVYPDLLGCLAVPWEFWRATLMYHFLVASNAKQRGRLVLSFVPNWDVVPPAHLAAGINAYSTVLNLTDASKSFKAEVPFFSPISALQVHRHFIHGVNTATPIHDVYNLTAEMRAISTGRVYLWVYTRLTSGDTATSAGQCAPTTAEILPLRSAKDLELNGRSSRRDWYIVGKDAVFENAGTMQVGGQVVPFTGNKQVAPARGADNPNSWTSLVRAQDQAAKLRNLKQVMEATENLGPTPTSRQIDQGITNPPSKPSISQVANENANTESNASAEAGFQDAALADGFEDPAMLTVTAEKSDKIPLNFSNVFGVQPHLRSLVHFAKRPGRVFTGCLSQSSGHYATDVTDFEPTVDIPSETLAIPITVGVPKFVASEAHVTSKYAPSSLFDYFSLFYVGFVGNLRYHILGDYMPALQGDRRHRIEYYPRNFPQMKGRTSAEIEDLVASQGVRMDDTTVPFAYMSRGKHAYTSLTAFVRSSWIENLGFNSDRPLSTRIPSGLHRPIVSGGISGAANVVVASPYTSANYDPDRCSAGVLLIKSDIGSMLRPPLESGDDIKTRVTILRSMADNGRFVRLYNTLGFAFNDKGYGSRPAGFGLAFPDFGSSVDLPTFKETSRTSPVGKWVQTPRGLHRVNV